MTRSPLASTQKERRPESRDLNSALAACFTPENDPTHFPIRLIEFAAALISHRNISIWGKSSDGDDVFLIAQDPNAKLGEVESAAASQAFQTDGIEQAATGVAGAYLTATIAMPDGLTGMMLVGLPAGGAVSRSLAYERLTMLSNLSYTQFRHGDITGQSEMIAALTAIAAGDHSRLQQLADLIAQLTASDYSAAGFFDGRKIFDVKISGQTGITKRASLPAKVKTALVEVATKKLQADDRIFAARPGRSDGLVLSIQNPQRNTNLLRLAGAIFAQAQQGKPQSGWTTARLIKTAAICLIIGAIGLIPVADGAHIPATVEASDKRVITSPLSATIAQVLVRDKEQVEANETLLIKLATPEIDLEIIEATAERANAILERETARASRNAAVLRNAELEVERLDARLDLLELQRDSSRITAPISGVVVLQDVDQRIGATVRKGEALVEVSNPSALRLSLAIVDTEISNVSEGDIGVFRPDFDPSIHLEAKVSRISPAVDNTEEIPVILGKAEFTLPPGGNLRPGISGVFAVGQEYRPIGQILYRNIRDWILLRVWI